VYLRAMGCHPKVGLIGYGRVFGQLPID